MIIKNITGGRDVAAKVIGIGPIWLQPDEEKTIPDSMAYVDETDDEGRLTGKKVILPAIKAQERLGMIKITETKAEKKSKPVAEDLPKEPAVEDEEAKKAATAAKRAATRAANKAAKETAEE